MTPTLLVTGTRHEPTPGERARVISLLTEAMPGEGVLYVGDCPTGIDNLARCTAQHCGWDVRIFRADWRAQGKRAGPMRNMVMVEAYTEAGGEWALAFPAKGEASKGTMGCVSLAAFAGIRIDVHPVEVDHG